MDKADPHLRREMSRKKCELVGRIPDNAAAGDNRPTMRRGEKGKGERVKEGDYRQQAGKHVDGDILMPPAQLSRV